MTSGHREAAAAQIEPQASVPFRDLEADIVERLLVDLYPIGRSITGDGVRATLHRIANEIPDLVVHEVPSGTAVLDWVVPDEWNLRQAWIAGPDGRRLIDVADSSLHVMGYSEPVRATMTRDELLAHVHTLPTQPTLVPYRTSYYKRAWAFCLSHDQLDALGDGPFDVCIDATLAPGSLTYGELTIPVSTGVVDEGEVLLSTHVCHPGLANDNLTGIAALVAMARRLAAAPLRRHTVRMLFIPGTIGAIAWLATHRAEVEHIRAGLVVTGLGDAGGLVYKRSRRGTTLVDRAAHHVLGRASTQGVAPRIVDFSPYGYDERQFCSPGFDLPVGRLTRTPHGEYPEYHTSGDDLSFVSASQVLSAVDDIEAIVAVVDRNATYVNLAPFGEPQLGRRGLYGDTGGTRPGVEMGYLWLLSCSDGSSDLLAVAERSGLPVDDLADAADRLVAAGLLQRIASDPSGPEAGAGLEAVADTQVPATS